MVAEVRGEPVDAAMNVHHSGDDVLQEGRDLATQNAEAEHVEDAIADSWLRSAESASHGPEGHPVVGPPSQSRKSRTV
jgi:hypothetical protein